MLFPIRLIPFWKIQFSQTNYQNLDQDVQVGRPYF